MRVRYPLPFFALAALTGCYQSGDVLTQDSGVRSDAVVARDAPPTVIMGDPLRCETAPLVPIDARIENIDASGALSPEEGSCWEPNSERRAVYYQVEVPAHTGVEVRTTSATDAPIVSFVDRCTDTESRCIFFQNTDGDAGAATSRRWYYGNPSDATQRLILSLYWFPTSAMTGAEPPGVFTLETESHALPTEATCETPLSLPADTLLPASTARGGTYENWDCIRRPEAHFVTITIPPRDQAIALDGSQPLNQRSECGCTPEARFPNELSNFTDAPRTLTLERIPEQPIGVRYAALPVNATCTNATLLEVGADEASAATEPVASYDAAVSEHRADACGSYNDAVWYRVMVPAGRRVRVRAELNSPYPALHALNAACGAVDADSCTPGERLEANNIFVDLTNTTAAAVERTVVVAYDGPPGEGPLLGIVSAFLVGE